MTGAFVRADALARLADERFDVVVVGGGITGAGVALDAASRGLRTALVERGDFASGTSSKSSKLVHGGMRYLQQREYRLVYDALRERQIALRNAPHLVRVLPFLIPILTRDGLIDRRIACSRHGDVVVRPHRWSPHRQAAPAHQQGDRARAHADPQS
jgi:glycerol-3-phosphate dehydrogenase